MFHVHKVLGNANQPIMTESDSAWIRVEREGRDYEGHKKTFFFSLSCCGEGYTFAKTYEIIHLK